MNSNPFRQKLDRKQVKYKTSVWPADSQGKASSQVRVLFALSDDYIWLSQDFSVPLSWLLSITEVGPGFLLTWKNPISSQNERAAFCIRTFFGYNKDKRDEIIQVVRQAMARAAVIPVRPEIALSEVSAICEKCGAQQAQVYDFQWLISVWLIWIKKPSRETLCHSHAKNRLLQVFASNFLLGNLGVGVFGSPLINLSNVNEAYIKGAISAGLASVFKAIGFIPYLLIAGLFVWTVIT
jgi:hypothetical protein